MQKIVSYVAHDAVTNTEKYLEEYDSDTLAKMEKAGMIFLCVYEDGTREIVKAEDIKEPEPRVNGVQLATPYYVDVRTKATVAVFSALEQIIDPEAQVATTDETGEETEMTDPLETFKQALEALKELEVTAND